MTWDEFILKMRQGEIIETGIGKVMLYSVSVNQNVKLVYHGVPGVQSSFCGILSCNENSFYTTKYESFLNRMDDAALYPNVENFEDIKRKILDLIIRIKTDEFINGLGEQVLTNKDMTIEFIDTGYGTRVKRDYSDLENIAMGLNNYICYRLMYSMYDENEGDLLSILAITAYLDKGIDGLKEFASNSKAWDYEFTSLDIFKSDYDKLHKKYSQFAKVSENISSALKVELYDAIFGKGTLTVNREKVRGCDLYGDILRIKGGSKAYMNIEDVETIEYRNKEIYNRDKLLESIKATEVQAGMNGLIELASDNFREHNGKINYSDKLEWTTGDLVYTRDDCFGVIMGGMRGKITEENSKDNTEESDEDRGYCLIYLYNGRREEIDIDNIDFLIKDSELNDGLRQVKSYITRRFHKEQQMSGAREQELER